MSKYLIHPLPNVNILSDFIPKYLRMWHELSRYPQQETVLRNLFNEHPLNDDLEIVVKKIALLNEYYSTAVSAVRDMAMNILSIPKLDQRLKEGDISIVDEIKKSTVENFSFASKFCSFHNPEAFPIYDSFVAYVLSYYHVNDEFLKRDMKIGTQLIQAWESARKTKNNGNTKNYEEALKSSYKELFYPIIGVFRNKCSLENYTYKQLDRFLWQMGKEYFVDYCLTKINEHYIIILEKSKASLYELCVRLHNGQTKQVSVGGREYVGIATIEDVNVIIQLLEEHCNYVSRRDGLIGEFYVDATELKIDEKKRTISDGTIKVFHKIDSFNIKDGRKKNVLKDIAKKLIDKEHIEIEKYQKVCDEEMQVYEKRHPKKK